MSLNEDLREIAARFNRLVETLPQDVATREVVPRLETAQVPPPALPNLIGVLSEILTLDQQLWLSRPENLAKVEPFLRSPYGRAVVTTFISNLQAFR